MGPIEFDDVREFDEATYQKVGLVETDAMFVDVYCFEPGQAQVPHVHEGADKVYAILEGTATITLGEDEHEVGAGELVHAPSGLPHGMRNESDERVRALVTMTPPPTVSGGHHHEHVERAARRFAIITVTSSRTEVEDEAGRSIRELLETDEHEVVATDLVEDDVQAIRATLETVADRVDAVILTGGTGITPDDVTIEAVRPLFDKELDGFGEHFRRLSVDEIGSAVVMTRTTAGVVDGTVVFALPGSVNAVELAVREIILREVDHLVDHAIRET